MHPILAAKVWTYWISVVLVAASWGWAVGYDDRHLKWGLVGVLIVGTSWPEYRNIDPAWAKRDDQKLTILDLWRTLPAEKFGSVADVLYLGSGR